MTSGRIARKLSQGWSFQVDWRAATIAALLQEEPEISVGELCRGELDPVIRQGIRFRKTGTCVAPAAFEWAYKCEAERCSNAAAPLLRAMVIANCSADDIALRLGTSRLNVIIYEKLFFAVRPYLQNRAWLVTVALPAELLDSNNPWAVRERLWMSAAFHRGQKGLASLLLGAPPKGAAELQAMTEAIRAVLVQRAYNFAMQKLLDAPEEADLTRLAQFSLVAPAEDRSLQQEKMGTFMRRCSDALFAKGQKTEEAQHSNRPASAQSEAGSSSAACFGPS